MMKNIKSIMIASIMGLLYTDDIDNMLCENNNYEKENNLPETVYSISEYKHDKVANYCMILSSIIFIFLIIDISVKYLKYNISDITNNYSNLKKYMFFILLFNLIIIPAIFISVLYLHIKYNNQLWKILYNILFSVFFIGFYILLNIIIIPYAGRILSDASDENKNSSLIKEKKKFILLKETKITSVKHVIDTLKRKKIILIIILPILLMIISSILCKYINNNKYNWKTDLLDENAVCKFLIIKINELRNIKCNANIVITIPEAIISVITSIIFFFVRLDVINFSSRLCCEEIPTTQEQENKLLKNIENTMYSNDMNDTLDLKKSDYLKNEKLHSKMEETLKKIAGADDLEDLHDLHNMVEKDKFLKKNIENLMNSDNINDNNITNILNHLHESDYWNEEKIDKVTETLKKFVGKETMDSLEDVFLNNIEKGGSVLDASKSTVLEIRRISGMLESQLLSSQFEMITNKSMVKTKNEKNTRSKLKNITEDFKSQFPSHLKGNKLVFFIFLCKDNIIREKLKIIYDKQKSRRKSKVKKPVSRFLEAINDQNMKKYFPWLFECTNNLKKNLKLDDVRNNIINVIKTLDNKDHSSFMEAFCSKVESSLKEDSNLFEEIKKSINEISL